jgi:hypothetical protein
MYYSAQALRLRDLRVSYAAVLAAALFYVTISVLHEDFAKKTKTLTALTPVTTYYYLGIIYLTTRGRRSPHPG